MSAAFQGCLYLAASAFVVESLLYFTAPQLLAKLAFLPVGPPRMAHIPQARLDSAQTQAPYRGSARAPLTLDSIRVRPRINGADTVGAWTGTYGWLRLTTLWFGWNRSWGVARIQAEIRGEHVRLSAKGYPMPVAVVTLLPVLVTLTDSIRMPLVTGLIASVVGIVIVAVNWGKSAMRLRPEVQRALVTIARDIEGQPRREQGTGDS